MIHRREQGFTLVELLLAMAFFSFILLFITTGFLVVNRAYNQGLTAKLVQDETRKTMELLSREIRQSSFVVVEGNCVELNGSVYHWTLHIDGDSNKPMRLVHVDSGSCSAISPTAGNDLLHERVGVQSMSITPTFGGAYSLKIVMSTSAEDLLTGSGESTTCKVDSGAQYCDVVEMTTIVSPRGSS